MMIKMPLKSSANLVAAIAILLAFCMQAAIAAICQKSICEYNFVIRRARTMVYQTKSAAYNVELRGRRLVIMTNSWRTAATDSLIGTTVSPKDVHTADGFPGVNVILTNEQFPGPPIEVMEGAQVVVRVKNELTTDGVTIHWHGIHVDNTPWMDGVGMLTQCPIPYGQTFTYRFLASQTGTLWYHDHYANQRRDGLYGALIIHKKIPTVPSFNVFLTDWYHKSAETSDMLSPSNPFHAGTGEIYSRSEIRDYTFDGSEVSPLTWESALINGRGRWQDRPYPLEIFNVQSSRRYRFRLFGAAAERGFEVSIDDHKLIIMALDGQEVEPVTVDFAIIYPGERIDFEVVMNQRRKLYWMRARTLRTGKGPNAKPDGVIHSVNAVIAYNGVSTSSDPVTKYTSCSGTTCTVFNCPFRFYPSSYNRRCIYTSNMKSVLSTYELAKQYGIHDNDVVEHFFNFANVIGSTVNGRVFLLPYIPFYQPGAESSIVPCNDRKCDQQGCACTYLVTIPYDKTIQMVWVNTSPGPMDVEHHPIHSHGHNFAVVKMGYPTSDPRTGRMLKVTNDIACNNNICSKPQWRNGRPAMNTDRPPIKDTVIIPAGGYAVIRYKSNNPGYWFVHCHVSMHVTEGMGFYVREAVDRVPPLPAGFPIGCGHFDWSSEQFLSYQRNAKPGSDPNPGQDPGQVPYSRPDQYPGPDPRPDTNPEPSKTDGTCYTFDRSFRGTEGEETNNVGVQRYADGDCMSGACAYFNGRNAHLTLLPGGWDSNLSQTFSLSLWVKAAKSGVDICINQKNGVLQRPSFSLLVQKKNKLLARIFTNRFIKSTTKSITVSKWHHVVVTWGSQEMTTFMDGYRISQKAESGRMKGSLLPLNLGGVFKLRRFRGRMDQVCVYKRVLSLQEVKKLHKNPAMTLL